MQHYSNLIEMHRHNNMPMPESPLFSAFKCTETCSTGSAEFTTDFYMIGFKKLKSGVFKYGRTKYDHDMGCLSFIKPRQVIQFQDLELEEDGFLIFIHEDYLVGNSLYKEIDNYSYFDYEVNEALHVSTAEESIIWDLFNKIYRESHGNQDEFSQSIILAHVESMIKYSERFYKRQFINRSNLSGKTISKFNDILKKYFSSQEIRLKGLPSVSLVAEELHLSSRYLSDLLKQETGKTAIELIHIYLINEAKNRIRTADLNISEVAYDLGFENLSYFSRLFKKETGLSPTAFKKQLLN